VFYLNRLSTAKIIIIGSRLRNNGGRKLTGEKQKFFQNLIPKGLDMNKAWFMKDGATTPPTPHEVFFSSWHNSP
jgi:hypothetical protein